MPSTRARRPRTAPLRFVFARLLALLSLTSSAGAAPQEEQDAERDEWIAAQNGRRVHELPTEVIVEVIRTCGPGARQDPTDELLLISYGVALVQRTAAEGAFTRERLGALEELAGFLVEVRREDDVGTAALRTAVWIYTVLVDAAMRAQDLDEAGSLLDRALAGLPDRGELALARSSFSGQRGLVFTRRGLNDRALALLERDYRLQREAVEDGRAPDQERLFHALVRLTDFYLATGRYDDVVPAAEEALQLEPWRETRPDTLASVDRRLGVALWHAETSRGDRAERLDAARAAFERALGREFVPAAERVEAELWLGLLADLEGDGAAARTKYEAGQRAMEELRAATPGADVGAVSRRLDAVLGSRLARGSGDAVELARARTALGEERERMFAAWRTDPLRPGGMGPLFELPARWVVSESLLHELEHGGGASAALERLSEARAASGSLVRSIGDGSVLESPASAVLPPGTGALVYLPLWFDEGHVFAVTASGVQHARCRPWSELKELARELGALLLLPPSASEVEPRSERRARIESMGSTLARGLLPGELSTDGWTELALVGTDLLDEYVPFEALPFEGSSLGLERAVYYLPSLELGARLSARTGTQESEGDLALVSEARPARELDDVPALGTLELTSSQRSSLVAAFARDRVVSWRGEAATPATLRSTDLTRFGVLHVLTHGLRDPARERPAGLALTPGPDDDGVLWADDVERMRSAPVVLLPACGASLGPLREGDGGASDLRGAFFRAGAHTVVLPRANVSLNATVALMAELQEGLARGLSTAEALRRSRVSLAGHEEYSDPFYHALVHVQGLGALPPFPGGTERKGGRRWLAVLAIAIVASVWMAAARRRRSRVQPRTFRAE